MSQNPIFQTLESLDMAFSANAKYIVATPFLTTRSISVVQQ